MTMMMTCCYDYTTKQRIAFYAIGLGLSLCIVGCASPYWLSGQITDKESVSHLIHNLPRVDGIDYKTSTFDINVGLWWYCVGLEGREEMCFDYPPDTHDTEYQESGLSDDSRTYVILVRTLMCGCLLVALTGLLVVCFYCCTCCSSGNTLGYGLVFFLAGMLGFAAVFVLTFKVDVLLGVPHSNVAFGWAFPVFLTGNSLMVIASGILCIPPIKADSFKYETVFAMDIPQHEIAGQMGVYEPLPATLTICKTDC